MRGSVPFKIRPILAECLKKMAMANAPQNMVIWGVAKAQAKSGVKAADKSPAKDDIRNSANKISQLAAHKSPTGQAMANSRPPKLATPLPPLKPRKTG